MSSLLEDSSIFKSPAQGCSILARSKKYSYFIGPGTSLKIPGTSQGGGPSPAVRYVIDFFKKKYDLLQMSKS